MGKTGKLSKELRSYPSYLRPYGGSTRLLREDAVKILGGKCIDCGETDVRVLQINHVDDTYHGMKQYKLYHGIIKGTIDRSKVDVRCANHNVLYEYEKTAKSGFRSLVWHATKPSSLYENGVVRVS